MSRRACDSDLRLFLNFTASLLSLHSNLLEEPHNHLAGRTLKYERLSRLTQQFDTFDEMESYSASSELEVISSIARALFSNDLYKVSCIASFVHLPIVSLVI